jgi:hypothetical protein
MARVSDEISRYMAKLGRKGGKLGAITTNAKLTTAQRKRAGKKAAAALTPAERIARAQKAARARWGKKK